MPRLSIAAGIVFVGLIWGPTAAHDPSEVIELYGNGVHAYYARQNFKAYELLTQVISSDTKDPRAYYFRAMTLMRMGREAEARADMEVGAMLEATDADGAYPIARSLERVQGRNRRMLEKYRRQARFGALQQRQSLQRLKYETTRRREADVLRKQVQLGIEDVTPTDGAAPREPAPLPASAEGGVTREAPAADLFQPAAPEGVAPKDAGSTLEEMADPFGELPDGTGEETETAESTDVTPPNDGATEDDPFGESEAPAAEETAPAEPATPTDDSTDVDVGERVKGKKLVGILGGLLGKAIGKPLENMAGNASDKLGGPGTMGPGMGQGMGPVPPGMGRPGGEDLGGEDARDPFGEDIEDAPGTMPEGTGATGDADDPFGDEAPSAMEEDNGSADSGGSDPFGETPDEEVAADDPLGGSNDDAGGMTDDPFGDDPTNEAPANAAPAEEAPAEEAPADDPFGDATSDGRVPADDRVPEDPFYI